MNFWSLHRKQISLLALVMLLLLTLSPLGTTQTAQATPDPKTVTVAGTIQSKLGCPKDWSPDCSSTFLTYNKDYDLWLGSWTLAAGDYEYKAALNGGWDENYGAKAAAGGGNVSLTVDKAGPVKFYYDHKTHWVADSKSATIATIVGNFQTKIGCAKDFQADCLKTWMQNPKADGIYTLTTSAIPQGNYEAKIAINESSDQTFGANGAPNGANIAFSVPFSGASIAFKFDAKSKLLTVGEAQQGDISLYKAHWVAKDTIAWKIDGGPDNKYKLYYDPNGKLGLETSGVSGGNSLDLTYDAAGLNDKILKKYPQLAGFAALKINQADQSKIPDILKGQIAVSALRSNGRLLDATSLQIAGVLDDIYQYDGQLGPIYQGNTPSLKLWSPTARNVKIYMYKDSTSRERDEVPMTLDAGTGIWTANGSPDWSGKFYLYEVEVFVPSTGKVEKNLVTDPYSLSLATNSKRSQIVNLSDAALAPDNWANLKKPELKSLSDIVLYELHIRDFSISDQTVPEAKRGTYLAFTEPNSNGMKHLKALADAGLTHIHLLPAFDFATVEEDKTLRKEADTSQIASETAVSDQQQTVINKFAETDGFNWGYDPFHYTVPEGSYASQPDGASRIKEFRQMVQGLNQSNLRVIMDVVYNHTTASGQDFKSVLDRIVPGYYQRLNPEGKVENSTCCANTASENVMMEKLMVDSVLTWAKYYKIDGFRFDLMGHHFVSNMTKIRDALRGLTLAKDGVDGSKIYVYGEGWDFGEVAKNARGQNATQINLAGTGIGTFNDRLRDGVRGGGPFNPLQEQGFATGLYYSPNDFDKQGTKDEQKARLLKYADWIKIGLAGNLKDYSLTDATGQNVMGEKVDYNGAPAGYAGTPLDTINYVEAHDNETFFDALAFKAATNTKASDRARMQDMGLDIVGLSQGIPFFHAGQDMLRSKSLDRDSYNSGDWFNRLDFSYQSNNFGVGLPVQSKNGTNWPLMKTLLGTASIKPAQADILQSVNHMREMLQIRKSSKLFRLETADDIKTRLKFLNNGPSQTPGLIVMTLNDTSGPQLDAQYKRIVVVFNATPQAQDFKDSSLANAALSLHPVQAASSDIVKSSRYDAASGTLNVPAMTTAVFVESRNGTTNSNNQTGTGATNSNNQTGNQGGNTTAATPATSQTGSSNVTSGGGQPGNSGAASGQGGNAPSSPKAGQGGTVENKPDNTLLLILGGLVLIALTAGVGLVFIQRRNSRRD